MSAGLQLETGTLGNAVAVSATNPLPTTSTVAGAPVSAANPDPVAVSPNGGATYAIAPQFSTVAEGSRVLKASAGNLYGINVVSGAAAGYLLLFNSTTVPADGTVTPVKAFVIAANASLKISYDLVPLRFTVGCVAVFSTTGPFTKTISATAFISGEIV